MESKRMADNAILSHIAELAQGQSMACVKQTAICAQWRVSIQALDEDFDSHELKQAEGVCELGVCYQQLSLNAFKSSKDQAWPLQTSVYSRFMK
jgi:hypothetical protein